jgi:integral membrane sensor domain MASE1
MHIPNELKRKIAFAMSMGVVTTGIISVVLVVMNAGMSGAFLRTWLRCWLVSYLIVIPAILIVGPRLQARVDRIFEN